MPSAQKMESIRGHVTGARSLKCHFVWYLALKNTTLKSTEFLKFFSLLFLVYEFYYFWKIIKFFQQRIVKFLSNKNVILPRFALIFL